MAFARLADTEDGVYVVECEDCGFLVYARFLSDAKILESKHDRTHRVITRRVGGHKFTEPSIEAR